MGRSSDGRGAAPQNQGASKGQFQRGWHGSGAAFLLFYQLAANALTFERSQIIDEEFAFKMIYFMLQADPHQAVQRFGEWFSLSVEGRYLNHLWALHGLIETWNRQTAFVVVAERVVYYRDFWVNEHAGSVRSSERSITITRSWTST
ncbi:MAG: hypothetical protein CM15mP74_13710 [Halieaceae bacterium]|nr:MAG: hypothetical protein CM15mP74_13710 [Halieaceae bacterium]